MSDVSSTSVSSVDSVKSVNSVKARAEADGVEFVYAMFVEMHGKPCAKLVPIDVLECSDGTLALSRIRSAAQHARQVDEWLRPNASTPCVLDKSEVVDGYVHGFDGGIPRLRRFVERIGQAELRVDHVRRRSIDRPPSYRAA